MNWLSTVERKPLFLTSQWKQCFLVHSRTDLFNTLLLMPVVEPLGECWGLQKLMPFPTLLFPAGRVACREGEDRRVCIQCWLTSHSLPPLVLAYHLLPLSPFHWYLSSLQPGQISLGVSSVTPLHFITHLETLSRKCFHINFMTFTFFTSMVLPLKSTALQKRLCMFLPTRYKNPRKCIS